MTVRNNYSCAPSQASALVAIMLHLLCRESAALQRVALNADGAQALQIFFRRQAQRKDLQNALASAMTHLLMVYLTCSTI